MLAAEEAVRRELVAGVGGVVGEMLGTARLTLLKLQVNLSHTSLLSPLTARLTLLKLQVKLCLSSPVSFE